MGMLAWVMMGLALWHFTIWLPDRSWGGIVGAFIGVLIGAAALMFGAMLGAGRLIRPTRPQQDKYISYESGSDPVGGWGQSNVRYYIYALLFVIFDVEAVFIFPWAVNLKTLDVFGLVEMTVFILVLTLGLVYAWRKGVLRWA